MAHLQRRGTMGLMGLSQTQSEMQLYCLGEQKNHPETTTDDLCCLSTVRSFFLPRNWSHRITLKGVKNGSSPWTPMLYFYNYLKSGIWVWVTSCDGLTMKFCAKSYSWNRFHTKQERCAVRVLTTINYILILKILITIHCKDITRFIQ